MLDPIAETGRTSGDPWFSCRTRLVSPHLFVCLFICVCLSVPLPCLAALSLLLFVSWDLSLFLCVFVSFLISALTGRTARLGRLGAAIVRYGFALGGFRVSSMSPHILLAVAVDCPSLFVLTRPGWFLLYFGRKAYLSCRVLLSVPLV